MLHRIVARFLAVLFVASFAVLLGRASDARAADNTLVVTQDESSMERLIESNLTEVHKLIVTEKMLTPDDLYLDVPLKGDPMPACHITIDTQSANQDPDTKKIIERAIIINLGTNIKVPATRRAAVLETLNDLNRRKIFASAYIDTDGEIVFGWNLNVMADGLPVEYVFDVVSREQKLWKDAYPEVQKALS